MNSTTPPQQRVEHLDPQIFHPGLTYSKYCEAYSYNAHKIAWFCIRKPERIEKIFKIVNKFLEVIAKVRLTADTSLTALAASFKNASDVLESLRFISILKMILMPENNKCLLFDPKVSFLRKGDRALLLGHSGCKVLRNLNKWKLMDLGTIGKCKIGPHLPCFHLITDVLMIASSSFGLLDSSSSLSFQKNYAKLKKCRKKIIKWKEWLQSLRAVQCGDQEVIRKLQNRCDAKIKQIGHQIELNRQALLDPKFANDTCTIQRIEALEKELTINENRRQELISRDYRELSPKNIHGKIENLRRKKKVIFKIFIKDIMKVASSVSKIFVIALALLYTAVNVTSTAPVVVLLACGIISDSIGLTKIYMEKGPRLLKGKARMALHAKGQI